MFRVASCVSCNSWIRFFGRTTAIHEIHETHETTRRRDELADFLFRHFFGMLLIVEEDKAADPAYIGAFGAEAKMPHPGDTSYLV